MASTVHVFYIFCFTVLIQRKLTAAMWSTMKNIDLNAFVMLPWYSNWIQHRKRSMQSQSSLRSTKELHSMKGANWNTMLHTVIPYWTVQVANKHSRLGPLPTSTVACYLAKSPNAPWGLQHVKSATGEVERWQDQRWQLSLPNGSPAMCD